MDWETLNNTVLVNPRFPGVTSDELQWDLERCIDLKGHFWLATSGTTGDLKWVALAKEAVLVSARAVNQHLDSTRKDVWISVLPDFHVGGLGILARGYLSGASVVDFKQKHLKWDPQAFIQMASEAEATLTALVPTQVYDLIVRNLSSPKSLRAVIVGGGALQENLFKKAVKLGWNLLPSYGLTECASQVATYPLHYGIKLGHSCPCPCPKPHENSIFEHRHKCLSLMFMPLSHVEININAQGRISIKSPSLLTGYAHKTPKGFVFADPKVEGYFETEDQGELREGWLFVKGREAGFIKIGGESVSVSRLEGILDNGKLELGIDADVVLIAMPDERLGHVIHLVTASHSGEISALVSDFQSKVLPFERIRQVHSVDTIPRTDLQKVKKDELLRSLTKS